VEKEIRFGTDGIRGRADQFPFTKEALINIGRAISQWSIKKYKLNNPQVLIVSDTRQSCEKIKTALSSGFNTFSLKIVDAGVLPTSAALQLIKNNLSINFGIVISASHNPYTDNGIKLFDREIGKLNTSDEKTITSFFSSITERTSINQSNNFDETSNLRLFTCPGKKALYKKNVISHFNPKFLKGLHIVLDCANGATYKVAPEIFTELGAKVTTLASTPNGKNINYQCGTLHTENLQKTVLSSNADIGFAFDGDGDRVIAINKNGQTKDGDDLLAILTQHPKLKVAKKIVGTIMTNYGLEQDLKQKGKQLIRTPVGDKHVSAKLEEENLILGGETSGHIIIRDYLNTGDGILAALKVLESIKITGNWALSSFKRFPQILINVPIKIKHNLSKGIYAKIIQEQQQTIPNGRIIARYSGTENFLRIMTEDSCRSLAESAAKTLVNKLQKILS